MDIGRRGRALRDEWVNIFAGYKKQNQQAGREIEILLKGELPDHWDAELPAFPADEKGLATREASGKVLNAIAKTVPWLIGGAGDLAPSTKTAFAGAEALEADAPGGRVMHFGVREHAMGAIVNGLVLSKLRAFGATFLIFSDYMRPSIRLAALMEIPVFHVFTHDSIGLGEDGPTHQPIEQLVALARDSQHRRVAACRCQRGARGVQGHHGWLIGRLASSSAGRSFRPSTAIATQPPMALRAAPTCWPAPSMAHPQ